MYVIGKVGSGKSSLLKSLYCEIPISQGEAWLMDYNLCKMKRKDIPYLRRKLGIVFQDFQLFSFSIRENIDVSRSGEDVWGAIRQAGIAEWVEKCSAGAETQVTRLFDENGVQPSGGEGQKLAIARAIYKNAPIMILDEPTSALDPRAEYEIYQRFSELAAGKTAVFISHRMSSSRFCDHIAVFQNGEITEYGTHEELMEIQGTYYDLFQLSLIHI